MSRKALGLTVAVVGVALVSVVALAQSRRVVSPAIEQINTALLEGKYDQVADLAASLDRQDPTVAALIARAAMARGKYQDAENLLRPIAQKAPTSESALELGLLLKMLGRPDATPILTRVASLAEVATDPRELLRAGRALAALPGRAQEANSVFRDAAGAAPRDAEIQAAWGELFLDKFNKAEAQKSFQDALRLNARWVPALIGSARALADENPPQAMLLAKKALEVNPSSVEAHLFIAQQAVDAGHRDEARESLKDALEVNPSSLDAHALLAGLAYVEDKTSEYDAEIAKALAIAPRYGEAYRVVGELASHNFRYDDAAEVTRKGMTLDPSNAQILSDMGIHLLRTGDEPEARRVLEESFKLDDYNQVTFNLLQMMDRLDTFVSVTDGDLTIKMDKAEAPVLGEYAMPLAKQALDTLSKRYQFTPKGPFIVEIFPRHDDFAVRTAGLPGLIGALGVCFGRVVTMDSPHANPGTFQWEATLWHELAHVITLQMSNHRIPRWLTEGISVYEETVQRPEWGRTMDMEFAALMNRNEVIKLRDLNAAFTDPRKIGLGYFQASLLVDHIVKTYGDDGLRRLVRSFAQGVDTEGAFKAAFNTDFDQMQKGFDATLEQRYGTLRAALQPPPPGTELSKLPIEALRTYANERPNNFQAQMYLAAAAQKADDLDEATKALEKAAALAPMATGEDSPEQLLAEIALRRGDKQAAIGHLQKAMAADFDNVAIPRQLVQLMREANVKDPVQLMPVYRRIVAIDPFDPEAHAGLGRLAMQGNQADVAIREFKAVVALNPVDQAAAFTDLAESYLKGGRRADARRQTLAALEIAPGYERAQDLLLQLAESRP